MRKKKSFTRKKPCFLKNPRHHLRYMPIKSINANVSMDHNAFGPLQLH